MGITCYALERNLHVETLRSLLQTPYSTGVEIAAYVRLIYPEFQEFYSDCELQDRATVIALLMQRCIEQIMRADIEHPNHDIVQFYPIICYEFLLHTQGQLHYLQHLRYQRAKVQFILRFNCEPYLDEFTISNLRERFAASLTVTHSRLAVYNSIELGCRILLAKLLWSLHCELIILPNLRFEKHVMQLHEILQCFIENRSNINASFDVIDLRAYYEICMSNDEFELFSSIVGRGVRASDDLWFWREYLYSFISDSEPQANSLKILLAQPLNPMLSDLFDKIYRQTRTRCIPDATPAIPRPILKLYDKLPLTLSSVSLQAFTVRESKLDLQYNNIVEWLKHEPNNFLKLKNLLERVVEQISDATPAHAMDVLLGISVAASGDCFLSLLSSKEPEYIDKFIDSITGLNNYKLMLLLFLRRANDSKNLYNILEQDFTKFKAVLSNLNVLLILFVRNSLEAYEDLEYLALWATDFFQKQTSNPLKDALQSRNFEQILQICDSRATLRVNCQVICQHMVDNEEDSAKNETLLKNYAVLLRVFGDNEYVYPVNGAPIYVHISRMYVIDDRAAPSPWRKIVTSDQYNLALERHPPTQTVFWQNIVRLIAAQQYDETMDRALLAFRNNVILYRMNINAEDHERFSPLKKAISLNSLYVLRYLITSCKVHISDVDMMYAMVFCADLKCLQLVTTAFVKDKKPGAMGAFLTANIESVFMNFGKFNPFDKRKIIWSVMNGLDLSEPLRNDQTFLHNVVTVALRDTTQANLELAWELCRDLCSISKFAATWLLHHSSADEDVLQRIITAISSPQTRQEIVRFRDELLATATLKDASSASRCTPL